MTKFSIIVPVYNVEKYINECVDSILNQEFNNYEIILINDGSTDNSGYICDEYIKKDSRIKVIHKENEGLSEARNIGIKNAIGEYLIFIDSDDWIFQSSLKQIAGIIKEENNPDIIINRIKSYYSKDKEFKECEYKFNINDLKYKKSEEIFKTCYNMNGFWAAAWIFVIRKKYIEDNNLFFIKGLLHEDEEWAPRLILRAKNIAFNNEFMYCNRANRIGSITSTYNIKKELDKLDIIDRLIEESKSNVYNQEQKKLLLSRCSSIYLGVLKNSNHYKNEQEYNELIEKLFSKKYTLKYSNKKVHKLVYIISNIFGVKISSKVIFKVGDKKC